MSTNTIVSLRYQDLKEELINDNNSIGRFIGIADLNKNSWSCVLYVGNEKFSVLYDGSTSKGIIESNFKLLLSKKNFVKTDFIKIEFANEVYLNSFNHSNIEFFVYRINLFETSTSFGLNTIDFVKTMQTNFQRLHNFEECDVVSFHRGPYSHHALLTDKVRMIVTHRWGEPEDGGQLYVVSTSLLGLPTEKACVSEDHLIEVAGYREISKSNHLYDRIQLPKPKEEILRDAKRRIGEKGYSVTAHNCQHFVSDLRNGTSYSPEIQGIINGAIYTAAAGLATLIFTGIYAYMNRNKSNEKKEKENALSETQSFS